MFEVTQPLPGIFHIRDSLNVCFTLLTGQTGALLVDTGYGLEDVAAQIKKITPLPLTVLLTHGHHDHALGSRFFDEVLLLPGEEEVYRAYTGPQRREKVLKTACDRGLYPDEKDYLSAAMPPCRVIAPGSMALGGLTACVLACPGHTPGSAVVYVPERKLLLTGDNWNPCTWLFFPEARPAAEYRQNMQSLLALDFDRVLCPHQANLYPREMMEKFVLGLTDEALRTARPCDTGNDLAVRTLEACLPGDQVLVFDGDKAGVGACDE